MHSILRLKSFVAILAFCVCSALQLTSTDPIYIEDTERFPGWKGELPRAEQFGPSVGFGESGRVSSASHVLCIYVCFPCVLASTTPLVCPQRSGNLPAFATHMCTIILYRRIGGASWSRSPGLRALSFIEVSFQIKSVMP
jgi:hypothetical protein